MQEEPGDGDGAAPALASAPASQEPTHEQVVPQDAPVLWKPTRPNATATQTPLGVGIAVATMVGAQDDDQDLDSDDDEDSDDGEQQQDDDEVDQQEESSPKKYVFGQYQGVLGMLRRVNRNREEYFWSRRDQVMEWREDQAYNAEMAAFNQFVQDQKQREKQLRAKLRARILADKRNAKQKALNVAKRQEFLDALHKYNEEEAQNSCKMQLFTTITTQRIHRERQQVLDERLAQKHALAKSAQDRIQREIQQELEAHTHLQQELQDSIAKTQQMGRQIGFLPAINTPPPVEIPDQSETCEEIILRVNPVRTTSANGVDGAQPMSPTKMTYFSVNLKRFKHAETIRGERIGDQGGMELARALLTGSCPRTKRIILNWNDIKYPGIASLCDAFGHGACALLQVLDLRFNSINGSACHLLLQVLDKGGLHELSELILQGNLLGDEGAKAFAHACLKGSLAGLETIDLRQNRIRNAGAQVVWNAFTCENIKRFCPKLKLLDIRRNEAQAALTRTFAPCPSHLEF